MLQSTYGATDHVRTVARYHAVIPLSPVDSMPNSVCENSTFLSQAQVSRDSYPKTPDDDDDDDDVNHDNDDHDDDNVNDNDDENDDDDGDDDDDDGDTGVPRMEKQSTPFHSPNCACAKGFLLVPQTVLAQRGSYLSCNRISIGNCPPP